MIKDHGNREYEVDTELRSLLVRHLSNINQGQLQAGNNEQDLNARQDERLARDVMSEEPQCLALILIDDFSDVML
nr:hypothetical protein [Halochromatium salexigens]